MKVIYHWICHMWHSTAVFLTYYTSFQGHIWFAKLAAWCPFVYFYFFSSNPLGLCQIGSLHQFFLSVFVWQKDTKVFVCCLSSPPLLSTRTKSVLSQLILGPAQPAKSNSVLGLRCVDPSRGGTVISTDRPGTVTGCYFIVASFTSIFEAGRNPKAAIRSLKLLASFVLKKLPGDFCEDCSWLAPGFNRVQRGGRPCFEMSSRWSASLSLAFSLIVLRLELGLFWCLGLRTQD